MGLLRAGLTGGIGCGKSVVARELRSRYHAVIIDMDEAGREAVERPEVQAALRNAFPARVFHPPGTLDRRALAEIVFSSAEERNKLNGIVHPAMLEIVREKMKTADAESQQAPYLIVDAALIFELEFEKELDAVITVYAPLDLCLRRAQKRDGLSLLDVQARLQAQLPVSEKIRRADYRLDNSGSLPALKKQVAALHNWLTALAFRLTSHG